MDPYTVLGGMQINAANMEIIMDISQKNWKVELPYDTAIPLMGIYSSECKWAYSPDTYTIHNSQIMEST
jgi:hypothetical protein